MRATSTFAAAVAFSVFAVAQATAVEFHGAIQVSGGKCLDVHAPDMRNNGGRIQVWSCNGQPQQIWHFNSVAGVIYNEGGFCLDVHAPDIANNGARVQIWACNGSAQQRWTVDTGRRSILISSGLCLDVHAPERLTNGGRVQVWSCNNSPQQNWAFGAAPATPPPCPPDLGLPPPFNIPRPPGC